MAWLTRTGVAGGLADRSGVSTSNAAPPPRRRATLGPRPGGTPIRPIRGRLIDIVEFLIRVVFEWLGLEFTPTAQPAEQRAAAVTA
jgi:hypothetical protein